MRGRRVVVLGDVMLDEFLWGKVARISPEAPVPVVEVTDHSDRLGGAANVASNVRALGGESALIGVVGDDAAGARIRQQAEAAGLGSRLVSATDGRPTTVKTRIIAHHQQVVRADRERAADVDAATEAALLSELAAALPGCGAVIVSDYQKGVVTARLMRRLVALARSAGVPVLVDPKVRHFARYRGVALVTPNQLEAEQASGIAIRSPESLAAAGARILRSLRCAAALITRGEHGMSLFRPGVEPLHVPALAREVFDVTGAGDTVIATLALAVASGASLDEAARLANHAASVVVGKVGTAVASPEEVAAAVAASPR
jgi:D-beta-D-heptose 7-phosphate kinase/D-beta-D-heptose 1-phosphate adenosyltransferase